ncbi:MAG: 16S rRNA (guanine(527)-N(7))-methyltransferase RsmG [bacterium]
MKKQAAQRIDKIRAMLNQLSVAGVSVKEDAQERLDNLANLIEEWNNRINLVSRKDIGRLVDYHFGDSLSALLVFKPKGRWKAIDIGGSNALPGLVMGAVTDSLDVTVCDLKHKREAFMNDACEIAGGNTRFAMARADNKDFQVENRDSFDLAIARSVGALALLIKWSVPLLRGGGLLIAYKGSGLPKEIERADRLLHRTEVDLLVVTGSPWSTWCNPLRKFAIVRKRVGVCQG